MEFKYNNRIEDIVELNMFLNKIKSEAKIKLKVAYYGYPLFIIWVIFKLTEKYSGKNTYTLVFLLLFIIVIWLSYFNKIIRSIIKIKIYLKFNKLSDSLKEKILILEDEKIIVIKNNENKVELLIKDIFKIYENDNNIYIFKRNYEIFIIIPISIFHNENEKKNFIKKISFS